MGFTDVSLSEEEALQNFLLDIDCLNELQPWTGHFNLFDILKITRTEIRHSNVLAWLLNPNENHGLGDSFLRAVVQEMTVNDENEKYDVFRTLLLDFYSFNVYREWKNIDILLVSDEEKFIIAIENKIGSTEHDNQLWRYGNTLAEDYHGYEKMLIFLTPEGDDPSDRDNWDVLSYAAIADILSRLTEEKELHDGARLMIENFIDVIRRDIVEDQKLIEVCNKIYAKHKKALDLIFEHRTDSKDLCVGFITSELERISDEGKILFDEKLGTGGLIIFHTAEMNRYLPPVKDNSSSWGTNYIYQYWVRMRDNKLCGIMELGGFNVPDDSMKTMQDMIEILKPSDRRREDFRYKRIFRTKWYDIGEDDNMQENIAACVREIVNDLLNKEKNLLKKLNKTDGENSFDE